MTQPDQQPAEPMVRPHVAGKFLFVGQSKYHVKGVTYGPFAPEADGCEYHKPERVEADFARMAEAGLNTVRVYTVPPRWLLDSAERHGLRVMVGLPWEQHVAFLDEPSRARKILRRLIDAIRPIGNHPALLCYAIGNEIPASIVRWHGPKRVERFLRRLYHAVKAVDATALVSYVNFPTTEYLRLPFVDFHCFNVYLEKQETLSAYLARLQNLAGGKPLVMAEVGLDSMRNGLSRQGETLRWQIRTCFAAGCAGMFVFAWTDEWYRGGCDIDDWAFGLTDRNRHPKPALQEVSEAFAEAPFPADTHWPRMSVVVCTYNGSQTIRECLSHAVGLDYPDYEVIVVNDGSTDGTAEVVQPFVERFGVRLINIPNRGLSAARNLGCREATGEVVAYLDDDAYPDLHWLKYLAHTFETTGHVGVGGPNIPPLDASPTAVCVAESPGGPSHVLLDDQLAEHIPGCNMAIRRDALLAIGGFDEQFRIAGDDVDVCWRLRGNGCTLGFHAGAMAWHHRRRTVGSYLRQQRNYGRAEGMLEVKWPKKFNTFGHMSWAGHLYGNGTALASRVWHWRVYHGVWGSSSFQRVYSQPQSLLRTLPLMPEWYMLIALLLPVALTGLVWWPLLWVTPLLLVVAGLPMIDAIATGAGASLGSPRLTQWQRLRCRVLIAALHVLQPIVRLQGRILGGLGLWRRARLSAHRALPMPRRRDVWCEQWQSAEAHLEQVESHLHDVGARCVRGGAFDNWDIEIRGTLGLCACRLRMAVEEHGQGRQLLRLRAWPRLTGAGLLVAGVWATAAFAMAIGSSSPAGMGASVVGVAVFAYCLFEAALCCGCFLAAARAKDRAERRSVERVAHDHDAMHEPRTSAVAATEWPGLR